MLGEIKLELLENAQITKTLKKETSTSLGDLLQSLLEFQKSANDYLTQLILSAGDTIEIPNTEDASTDDDDCGSEEIPVSTKKRKT